MIILTFGGGTNEIQRDLIAHLRPRHAAVAALSPGRPRRAQWTSPSAKSKRPSASSRSRSSASARPHERLKQVEAEAGDEGPFDRELWRELAGRRPARHPPGRGVRGRRARLRRRLPGRRAGRAHGGLRAGGRDHGLRRAADRAVRHGRAAQGLAARRGGGETILTAAMAELVGEGSCPAAPNPPPRRRPSPTARGCSRARRPASRRRSSPTPCWCPRHAGPSTARAPVSGSSSSTPVRPASP